VWDRPQKRLFRWIITPTARGFRLEWGTPAASAR
jgi:hypothetical protein